MINWNKIRDDFPVAKNIIYFMSAAMSPLPRCAADVAIERYRKLSEFGDIDFLNDIAIYGKVREQIGKIINSSAGDIVFVANTSTAMSLVALSLKNTTKHAFNIVSMQDEFPSTTVPFEYQDIEMKYVEPQKGRYPIDAILKCVDDKTLSVATSYVQYSTGFRQDIKKLGDELAKRDILFIVNSTQAFPLFPIDVKDMHIDVMSASVHKWGFAGHKGAVFYTSEKFREKYPSPIAGWLSVKPEPGEFIHTKKNVPFELHKSAECYLFGTMNFQLMCALQASLSYLDEIGQKNIEARIMELTDYLISKLKDLPVEIVTPISSKSERSAIVSINAGNDSKNCVDHLKENKIYVSFRNDNIRISVNIFNNEEDIDKLCSTLKKWGRFSLNICKNP